MLKVITNPNKDAFEKDVNEFISKCDKVTDIKYEVRRNIGMYFYILFAFITYEGKKVE